MINDPVIDGLKQMGYVQRGAVWSMPGARAIKPISVCRCKCSCSAEVRTAGETMCHKCRDAPTDLVHG